MVAQHPQTQTQPQSQPQQPASSAQDEALKRNTDCVYFLASPLTCKKGNECEYRHSEYARVNPRDCWYWLNGNCLNPKCSFRHPPLDGLLGSPAATPGGPSVPATQVPTTSAAHAPYNSGKQAIPCIFFQKGLCLKGDRCAFLHGPNTNTGNKVITPVPMASQGTEALNFKKTFGGNEKYTQERKTSQTNVVKSVGGPETKPAQKVETAPQRNSFEQEKEKRMPPPSARLDDEASKFKITSTPQVINGTMVARANRLNQAHVPEDHSFHNGKDSDEFLRESSPGFDVLVADELRNSDYYHGEDEFGKARGPDERDSLNEYDLGHNADYSLAADIDQERFRPPQRYDSYDKIQDPYMWEQHRKPSAHLERRSHRRADSPDNVEVSDLRHRLSKRRRVNGLKSVVSHDYDESHGEEQSQFSRKDFHQLPLNESSISNRFRGRIKLPPNGAADQPGRESDRGRTRSRLSSGRLLAPQQGRLQDRIRGRVQDDDRRNFKDPSLGDRSGDFARPKSLAELKIGRSSENKEQQSLGKRKGLGEYFQSEDDFQFEGPKPLSEILKEKRRGDAGVSGNSSDNKNREMINNSDDTDTDVTNTNNGASSETKEDAKNHLPANEEESKLEAIHTVERDVDNNDRNHDQTYEEGLIYDEAAEDQEYEGDDQREGDYDYEQVDEGDYEYVDEGENPEQEYIEDEEDGDDFAKKIGVMTS